MLELTWDRQLEVLLHLIGHAFHDRIDGLQLLVLIAQHTNTRTRTVFSQRVNGRLSKYLKFPPITGTIPGS